MSRRVHSGTTGHGRTRCVATCALLASLCGCDAVLYESLPQPDAKRVAALLDDGGVSAQLARVRGGDGERYSVSVAISEVHAAVAQLQRSAAASAPQQPGVDEVYGGGGLVPTPAQERARAAAALGGEIARTLQRRPEIVTARVHVAPETGRRGAGKAPGEDPAPQAAFLWVEMAEPAPARGLPDAGLAAAVAAAVPGLEPAQVVVQRSVRPAAAPVARPPWVRVGPLRVAPGSLAPLRAVLGGSLVLNALLAAALALLWRRRARTATPPHAR